MGNVAVYKKGTTDFFSQGVGLLSDVVSSNLTQTVSSTGNVEQKLEVEYPIDGYLVSELVEGAILRLSVSTDKSDYGVFEIVDTLKDDSGIITVYGDPYYKRILRMSFDNGGVFTKFSSVQSALNAAKQNITGFPANFNLISNLSTSVDLSSNTYEDFGTFLEALNSAVHGNLKYSLNSIQIYSALGKDITDITLRDDMNTSSVKITTDFSGIINKVIPVLPVLDKDGNTTDQTKVGTIVTSKYYNQFLDYWAGKVIQFDTQDLANTYFDRTNADRPVQTVEVDPIGLDDDFSTINIFDTIELYSTRLDYTDKLRVSEREFDTLAENVTSFKLGSSSVNIFNQINEQNDQIFNNVVKLTNAAISANGKGIDYFGQAQPASPKEGDTWFWDDGTDFGIKQYTNGEWVDLAGSKTAEKIADAVTDAVTQANAHTDEVQQGLSSDIDTAKSQAASLASAALASANSAATSQFTQAQSALSAAKTDLTNSIASEASARNAAVAAVNSQAQAYVNQAKSDITDTINAISVGGRNLLLTSSTMSNTSAWVSPSIKVDETYQGMNISANTAAWTAPKYKILDLYNRSVINENDTYTYSAFVRNTSDIDIPIGFFGNNNTTNFTDPTGIVIATMKAHTDWTRLSVTFKFKNLSQLDATTIRFEPKNDATNGYVNQAGIKLEKGNKATDWTPAPEDVVLDYTTKDNQIKATITQYQTTNDGKVSKAQTDATTALGLVETKISKTVYDQKTGELSSNINDVKDTADRSAQTIADIQEADGKQDARMSEIENTASGIKSTVSDLTTEQGKQSGYISTLQQRADGFDASFATINNTVNGLGQTNQLMNTEFTPDFAGWVRNDGFGIDKYTKVLNGSNVVSLSTTNEAYNYIWQFVPVKGGTVLSFSTYMHYTPTNPDGSTVFFRYQLVFYDDNNTALSEVFGTPNFQSLPWTLQKSENVTVPDTATSVRVTYYTRGVGYVAFSQPMLVFESTVGAYVQGNYNNNDALAKVKLTADQATLDLSTYKTDADGRISKAQAGVEANANAISQKVSQTDYDTKTGQLTTSVSKAQQTADAVTTSLGNYKQDADGRISANSADIVTNANAIKQKVAQSDYDANNTKLTSRLTTVETTANGTATTVSNLQQTVNGLGQVNQLFNTEFTPDYQSWTGYDTTFVNDVYTKAYKGSNVVAINSKDTGYHYLWQFVPVVAGTVVSFSAYMHYNPTSPDNSTVYFRYQLVFYNDNNTSVGQVFGTANLQSLDWVLQKSENIAVPTGATKVRVTFFSRGAGYAAIAQPMLVFASTVGTYVQGNYNNNAALAQVKITADSISNFVRDASGNISSDFQTALSKTSIITGSTLATSIQQQTATQITSALTDNNGKIISLINQDTSGVQIAGKNIVLDGNTTVTGDFYAKGGNFKNLNASNITVGTLNGTQVNITNINANNIVSGAISGANLNINLNTGSVVFQKGRINSSDYTTDINIDQGYISTANGTTRALLTQGKLQLVAPNIFSPQTTPYLEISNDSNGFNGFAGLIKARDSLTVSMSGHDYRNFNTPSGTETFVGMSIGNDATNELLPTKIGGANQGVVISGGNDFTLNGSTLRPFIYVGTNIYGSQSGGDSVYIRSSYLYSQSTYLRTTSSSANVVVNGDGALIRSSSARKYKLDIKNNIPIDDSLKLIDVPLSTWIDKHEHEENGSNERYFGMIAEDLRDAGLEYLVQYGDDNEVEGINYDRVALLLIPLVKELKERIEELESIGK